MTEQNDIAIRPTEPEMTAYEAIERVVSSGDLAKMDPQARVSYYWHVCTSLGLNPLTQPFSYLNLDGKIVLYARKDATEQLRRVNRVSVFNLTKEEDADGTFTVTAFGRLPDGREDTSTGIVFIKGLSGQALANAKMKAETKAKRRLTLSLVGLGFLDESEVEGIGEPVVVDHTTGEIIAASRPASLLEAVQQQTATMTSAPAVTFTPVEGISEAAYVAPSPLRVPDHLPAEQSATAADEPLAIVLEPMTPEASAAIEPEEEETEEELIAEIVVAAPPAGLTITELADLARIAGKGKLAFASALECVPADVGKRIEAMTDLERHTLAYDMGMLGAQPA
jgi:hypothetical protein